MPKRVLDGSSFASKGKGGPTTAFPLLWDGLILFISLVHKPKRYISKRRSQRQRAVIVEGLGRLLFASLEIDRVDCTGLENVEDAFSNAEILLRDPTEGCIRYGIEFGTGISRIKNGLGAKGGKRKRTLSLWVRECCERKRRHTQSPKIVLHQRRPSRRGRDRRHNVLIGLASFVFVQSRDWSYMVVEAKVWDAERTRLAERQRKGFPTRRRFENTMVCNFGKQVLRS